MWWAGADPVDVFLGNVRAGVFSRGTEPVWAEAGSIEEGCSWACERIGAMGHRAGRRAARIWLAGSVARPFLLHPLTGVKRRSEADLIAQRVAGEQTGLAGEHLVWLDDWRADRPCLATAADASALGVLQSKGVQATLAIRSIRPWWNAVLNGLLASGSVAGLIGVDDGESLTLLGGTSASFSLAGSYGALGHQHGVATLARTLMAHDDLGQLGIWAARSAPHGERREDYQMLEVPMRAVWRSVG